MATMRRTVGFILTLLFGGWLGYFVAWHPAMFGAGLGLLRIVGALVAMSAAVAFLAWGVKRPAGWKTIMAFLLGLVAAWAAMPLLRTLAGAGWGWAALPVVVVVAALWAITVVIDLKGRMLSMLPKHPAE